MLPLSKSEEAKRQLLLEEYKELIPQIIHWDSHFWSKSKFFLTFQSAFFGGAIYAMRDFILSEKRVSGFFIALFLLVAFFNIYLGYVWFRTNRRNREYLTLRFRRAKQIEAELGSIRTFTDDAGLPKNHGSERWETHLATGFSIAWIVVIVVVATFLFRMP